MTRYYDNEKIRIRRLQAEIDHLEIHVRRQKDDMDIAKAIVFMLRGRLISEEAYGMIRNAIETALCGYDHERQHLHPEPSDYYKEYVNQTRYGIDRTMKNPCVEIPNFKWGSKKEDFLNESEMEL